MDSSVLSIIGGLFIAYHGVHLALQVLQGIRAFVLPSFGFKKDLKKFGSWAVVTGSTDGIGKSYAKCLAKQGINIVLMSRNLEKLQKVEHEIKSEFNVQTRIIVIDFSGGPEIYNEMEDRLKDLDIGILVNNVGVGMKHPDYFLEFPIQDSTKMINVNIMSVVMMTYVILPMMVARKRGLVINISSMSGIMPCPLVATYSSTKAFVDFFSQCLNREYCDKGILVQCVMPGFVSTNMTKGIPTNCFVPLSDDYANQALGTVGMESRTTGYWSHYLMVWTLSLLYAPFAKDLVWKMWLSLRTKVYKARKRREEMKKAGHKD